MHLVTFGDNGTSSVRPEDHTEIIGTTDNFAVFKKWLNDIKFSGGGDAFEQGALGESVQYAYHWFYWSVVVCKSTTLFGLFFSFTEKVNIPILATILT